MTPAHAGERAAAEGVSLGRRQREAQSMLTGTQPVV